MKPLQFHSVSCLRSLLLALSLLCLIFSGAVGYAQAASDSYTLRPNDTILMAVFGEPDLTTTVKILKSGQASFPLIGTVKVGGMSISDATEKIRKLYDKDYLVEPKVTLTVNDYSVEYASVSGAVRSPGQLTIPPTGLDLSTALASAGGLLENANASSITLYRKNGSSTRYTKSHIDGSYGRVLLSPGDRIVVGESQYIGKFVSVLGQVKKPGQVAVPADGKLSLADAIAQAGGIDIFGNAKKININRKGRIYIVNFNDITDNGADVFLLKPDDVVTVPEKLF